jgi:predicted DNA-binding helix-hairpin-helix protein
MFYNIDMEAIYKLKDVAVHMDLEPAEELRRYPAGKPASALMGKVAPCGVVVEEKPAARNKKQMLEDAGVFHAAMPGGKTIPLLKTMLTSACERNCYYCPFRAGRNYKRVTFKPEEMAQTFMDMHRAGLVEGIFLSSGIIRGGQTTQDKLLDTVHILREKHRFPGYIHLKVMPGAERDQVREAMTLVNRISTNLEAPNPARLTDLAPMKRFEEELLQPLVWVEEIRRSEPAHLGWNGRWPSTTTQFVVGALPESDLELLATSEYLFQRLRLGRTYYSAFRPIPGTPLENQPAEDPLRQHRLYQASFLFRDYGFDLEDMPFSQEGNLPRAIDPKLAWAESHLADEPLELNRAQKSELLRVPGLGPVGVERILEARRLGTLGDIAHLRQLGLRTKPMEPFILLDGRRPSYQLKLF